MRRTGYYEPNPNEATPPAVAGSQPGGIHVEVTHHLPESLARLDLVDRLGREIPDAPPARLLPHSRTPPAEDNLFLA